MKNYYTVVPGNIMHSHTRQQWVLFGKFWEAPRIAPLPQPPILKAQLTVIHKNQYYHSDTPLVNSYNSILYFWCLPYMIWIHCIRRNTHCILAHNTNPETFYRLPILRQNRGKVHSVELFWLSLILNLFLCLLMLTLFPLGKIRNCILGYSLLFLVVIIYTITWNHSILKGQR